MIKVHNPIAEPNLFNEKCRTKGNEWLQDHLNPKRPHDYWSPFRVDLAKGFSDRCGYGAMWVSSGTVDHFISFNENNNLAYEWSNYRYIEGWINSSKQKKPAITLLDPFDVQEGWFEIVLPSMQLRLTNAIPAEYRQRAENTLEVLPLRDDERVLRTRREWYRMYQEGELTLEGLRKKAPLIANAIDRLLAAPQ